MHYGKYQEVIGHIKYCLKPEDFAHTLRVLGYALQILKSEKAADAEVVILASLLHDIGRADGNGYEHYRKGSEQSRAYLTEKGYEEALAARVADCIATHSTHSNEKPQTLEAKIVFDADKLDTTGAVGTARVIAQYAHEGKSLYVLGDDDQPLAGKKEEAPSLLRKYKRKLKGLEEVFFTDKAKKIAEKHQETMDEYFKQLKKEVNDNHEKMEKLLSKYCE